MSYHLLQSVLATAFVAVWTFIAVTMLRDKLSEARAKRVGPTDPQGPPQPKFAAKRRGSKRKHDQAVANA